MTMRNLNAIEGPLRRIWERIPVSCPTQDCQWVGIIGNYMAHAHACRCGPSLFFNHAATAQLENEIRELKSSHKNELEAKDLEIAALKLEIHTLKYGFDATYQYDRFRVIELTQLICRNLEEKPPAIDSNRNFNCVKKCFDDFERGWTDNPEYLAVDVRMLLNVCLASTWFTNNQNDCFRRWCQKSDW